LNKNKYEKYYYFFVEKIVIPISEKEFNESGYNQTYSEYFIKWFERWILPQYTVDSGEKELLSKIRGMAQKEYSEFD